MEKVDLFAQAKQQPQSLEELKRALENYQGLQLYLEAPEEEMSSQWWPLEVIRDLPFDPLSQGVLLPNFGGSEPDRKESAGEERILSWDEGRYLIVKGDEMRIIDRAAWDDYNPI